MRTTPLSFFLAASLSLSAFGCSSPDTKSTNGQDQAFRDDAVAQMHDTLLTKIEVLHTSADVLQKAAPDHAWDADKDKDAIAAVTAAWLEARQAYEQTEGAIAPLFPDIDVEIDERYDGFLEALAKDGGDQNLFDDDGVTGMHAIERIVFAPTTPQAVIDVEATLPGYKASAWPATDAEAKDFKDKLAARLVTDTQTLVDQWTPQEMDLSAAYDGLVALMNEQREKVNKAASAEEESRYSQRTMADIRDNLAGTKTAYALFQAWVRSKPDGAKIDADVEASFDKLAALYDTVDGDAFPAPPASWSSENPSSADLDTEFGKLFTAIHDAVDPNVKGSAVDGMNRAALAIGFTEFSGE